MSPSRSDPHSFERALALSVALHVCAAAFIVSGSLLPLGSGTVESGGHAFETTRVAYLSIERRARPRPPRAHPVTKTAPVKTVVLTTVAREPRRTPATPARAAASPGTAHATVKQRAMPPAIAAVRAERRPAPNVAPSPAPSLAPRVVSTAGPAPAPSPAATATASPAPAPAGATAQLAARGLDVPPGGWGQSFERPLVADESAIETLRVRYHASTAVRVEVDDSGRATHVILPPGLPDDVRIELERRLLELRYVPAECNGLRCTGTLQIVL